MSGLHNAITDVPGIKVGHVQNETALTGCTVILCEKGATGGVDQRGGAPGTRETDALRPMHLVDRVHGVLLAGGSAFGLDAASGVMRYLAERKAGFNAGVARVPIVPAAILFDLAIGRSDVFPDAEMGYQACQNASQAAPAQGNVGAGSGATVGKVLGMGQAMKSGVGTASIEIGAGVIVAALMVVNAFGDVVDAHTGQIIAGARTVQNGSIKIGAHGYFADTLAIMKTSMGRNALGFSARQNTVIGVVATNTKLTKEEANFVAQMAHNGIALAIRPAHTLFDGDTIFALAVNQKRADVNIVGAFAAQVVTEAILNAVKYSASAGGLPGLMDLRR